MKKRETINYIVNPGDTLEIIARRYNTSVHNIISLNGLKDINLMVGQQLLIPIKVQNSSRRRTVEREQQKNEQNQNEKNNSVTANVIAHPVMINGVNINNGVYPVLSYKPENERYMHVYVPVIEFEKLGAKVMWDERQQILSIMTEQPEMKNPQEYFQMHNNKNMNMMYENNMEKLDIEHKDK